MCKVNMYEAKTNLSRYVEMLETGKEDEIIITRYDKEVAKITIVDKKEEKKRLGAGIGLVDIRPCVVDSDEYGIEEMFDI